MDPRGLLSWNVLLFLSLAFERSCGTGCPTIFGRLGSSVLLPPVSDGISKSMNKSIHILITKAESPENRSSKKIVSLKLPEGGPSSHLENGYMFYPENLSLEILESEKEHEGWYTMTLEEIHSVQRFCLQLKLYEQVSAPEITVLNRTLENGNCSVVLACTVEKGDYVVYSWSTEAGTYPLSVDNGSHPLYLTLGPQHADDKYICSASNPISNRSQTFTPWSSCSSSFPVPRQWGLHVGLLLGGIIGVILIGQVVILLFRRRGRSHRPLQANSGSKEPYHLCPSPEIRFCSEETGSPARPGPLHHHLRGSRRACPGARSETKLHHGLCQRDTPRELTPQPRGRDWRKELGGAKRNTELGPRSQVLPILYRPALLGSPAWGCRLHTHQRQEQEREVSHPLSLLCGAQARDSFPSPWCSRQNGRCKPTSLDLRRLALRREWIRKATGRKPARRAPSSGSWPPPEPGTLATLAACAWFWELLRVTTQA